MTVTHWISELSTLESQMSLYDIQIYAFFWSLLHLKSIAFRVFLNSLSFRTSTKSASGKISFLLELESILETLRLIYLFQSREHWRCNEDFVEKLELYPILRTFLGHGSILNYHFHLVDFAICLCKRKFLLYLTIHAKCMPFLLDKMYSKM